MIQMKTFILYNVNELYVLKILFKFKYIYYYYYLFILFNCHLQYSNKYNNNVQTSLFLIKHQFLSLSYTSQSNSKLTQRNTFNYHITFTVFWFY